MLVFPFGSTYKNVFDIPLTLQFATMFPILQTLAVHVSPGYVPWKVVAFYVPYAAVPACLAIFMAFTAQPWHREAAQKTKAT